MKYHRTLCALALGAAVATGCSADKVWSPPPVLGNVALSRGVQMINGNGRELGLCFQRVGIDAPKVAPSAGGTTITAPSGQVITRVSIKAGSFCLYTPEDAKGTFTFEDGDLACYVVEGLGTPNVVVRHAVMTRKCSQIAWVQYLTGPAPVDNGGGTGGDTGGSTGGDTGGSTGGDTGGGSTLPPGAIAVCEASMQPNAAPFGITIAQSGRQLSQLSVSVGNCSAPTSLAEGLYDVTQALQTGWGVLSIFADPDIRIVSADPFLGTATVSVGSGETTTVTFLNDVLPQ